MQEIGGAASRVTEPTRRQTPEIPCRQIVGPRHRMVHVSFDIDADAVWEVVRRDPPTLAERPGSPLAQRRPPSS